MRAIFNACNSSHSQFLLVYWIHWREIADLSRLIKRVLNITSSTWNLLSMLSILALKLERCIGIFIAASSSGKKLSILMLLNSSINRANIMLPDRHIRLPLIWLAWQYLRGQGNLMLVFLLHIILFTVSSSKACVILNLILLLNMVINYSFCMLGLLLGIIVLLGLLIEWVITSTKTFINIIVFIICWTILIHVR